MSASLAHGSPSVYITPHLEDTGLPHPLASQPLGQGGHLWRGGWGKVKKKEVHGPLVADNDNEIMTLAYSLPIPLIV